VTNDAELADFIERRFGPAKAGLSARFDDAFRRLYSNTVQQYRLRYILAKLAQHVELQALGETEGTKWLSRYMGGGFEIEHIFPKTPSQKAAEEFGAFADPNVPERLGNLVLVEKSINASLGYRPYSEKCRVYRES
jgi:hypothetical protein